MGTRRTPNFEITWPLYREDPERSFPVDPTTTVNQYAPPSSELVRFRDRTDVPDSSAHDVERARRLRDSLPPTAPDWSKAARALVAELTKLIDKGEVDAMEHAAIARAWAAWSLAGASQVQIRRVAHLVSRAYWAIHRAAPGGDQLERAIEDCASVLHSGLPSALRSRMPVERAILAVRALLAQADAWAGVVEGTAELLGWKDYGRIHAASIIRAIIEREQESGT